MLTLIVASILLADVDESKAPLPQEIVKIYNACRADDIKTYERDFKAARKNSKEFFHAKSNASWAKRKDRPYIPVLRDVKHGKIGRFPETTKFKIEHVINDDSAVFSPVEGKGQRFIVCGIPAAQLKAGSIERLAGSFYCVRNREFATDAGDKRSLPLLEPIQITEFMRKHHPEFKDNPDAKKPIKAKPIRPVAD